MVAAKLRGVSYIYSEKTPFMKVAVDNVDAAFEEGMITGIIGHTGSGKSTIAQMINGLLRPSAGNVIVGGRDIWEKPKEIRNVRFEAGLVFQYPEYQLFEETVKKDIAFGPSNMGLSAEETETRVYEAMDFVGLDRSFAEKSPFDLSGGQKRRVAIAGIIAMRPRILILDEPAAGMNPSETADLMHNILNIRDKFGIAVLLIEHDMNFVMGICEGIAVLNFGRIIAKGTPEEIKNNEAVIEAYLGRKDK